MDNDNFLNLQQAAIKMGLPVERVKPFCEALQGMSAQGIDDSEPPTTYKDLIFFELPHFSFYETYIPANQYYSVSVDFYMAVEMRNEIGNVFDCEAVAKYDMKNDFVTMEVNPTGLDGLNVEMMEFIISECVNIAEHLTTLFASGKRWNGERWIDRIDG